jgi:hypothetical protein
MVTRPEILDRRRENVEQPLRAIGQLMNQGAFLMRRLWYVRGEFGLTALACGMRRTITVVDIAALRAAVGA